jgi:hypothetical protein
VARAGAGLRRLALIVILGLVAAACSSGASTAPGGGSSIPDGSGRQPASNNGNDGDNSGNGGGGGSGGGSVNEAAFLNTAAIVRTGSLGMIVADIDVALDAGRAAVVDLGGYISASRRTSDGDRSTASVTYRMPTARWEETLDAIRGLGTVASEETDATEVTGQIVDLEARIRNLRASETALQGIAAGATDVGDILDVEERLTEVRGEIERMQAALAALSDQAALGTLRVTYGLVVVAVTEVARGWDATTEVDRATAALIEVGQRVAGAGIWFTIAWLPVLLGLGLFLLLVQRLGRWLGVWRWFGSLGARGSNDRTWVTPPSGPPAGG